MSVEDLETAAALVKAGQYPQALVLAGALLRLHGDHAALHEMIAVCHRQQGAPEKAVAAYDRALARLDTADLWAGKGAALMEMQRPGKAAAALRRAAALQPDNHMHLTLIAQCERALGQPQRALLSVQRVLDADPADADALVEKAYILAAVQRGETAMATLDAALKADPDHRPALQALGRATRLSGQRDAARQLYARALKAHPKDARLHHGLSLVKDYVGDDPHLAQMRQLIAQPDLDHYSQSRLHFALFNALDQLDQCADAFAHLRKANMLRRATLGYDPQTDANLLGFLQELTFSEIPSGKRGPAPVFVVGMPCSGVRQAAGHLAAATHVHAGAMLPVVAGACMPLLRTMASEKRHHVTAFELMALQQTLRVGLADYAQGQPALIDATPLNFRFLGLVAAALPDASFIHVTRDVQDVGWGLYRRHFAGTRNLFAYDFEDIARFALQADLLIGHWRTALHPRLLSLSHDLLQTDPAAAVQQMVAHLPMALRAPHLFDASAVSDDTTDPLGMSGPGGPDAARYAPWLGPMRDALAT